MKIEGVRVAPEPMDKERSTATATQSPKGDITSGAYGVDCVVLSCFEHDVLFFRSMLGQAGIRLHRAETVEQADFLLLANAATVLLSDTAFLDGSWESSLAMARDAHPLVAVLVCAAAVDRDFVALAPNCGALGIYWKPLELARLREAILGAHEVSLERMLWRAEKEYEFRLKHNVAQSVFSEASK